MCLGDILAPKIKTIAQPATAPSLTDADVQQRAQQQLRGITSNFSSTITSGGRFGGASRRPTGVVLGG